MTDTATIANAGAERIERAIRSAPGKAALMPYVMGGYPDHDASIAIMQACVEGGADVIEFGIPYSDPLADGPLIQAAGTVALEHGRPSTPASRSVAQCRAPCPSS